MKTTPATGAGRSTVSQTPNRKSAATTPTLAGIRRANSVIAVERRHVEEHCAQQRPAKQPGLPKTDVVDEEESGGESRQSIEEDALVWKGANAQKH